VLNVVDCTHDDVVDVAARRDVISWQVIHPVLTLPDPSIELAVISRKRKTQCGYDKKEIKMTERRSVCWVNASHTESKHEVNQLWQWIWP
jgi:hypothetical protein